MPTTSAVFIDLTDIESVEVFNISGLVEKCGISISDEKTSVIFTKSGVYVMKIILKNDEIAIKKVFVK